MASVFSGMRKRPRTSAVAFVVAATLLVNFSWVHAAIVYATAPSDCDETVQQQAQDRLATYFGGVQSNPLIACLQQPHLGLGHIIGTTNFAPGLPSIILLNPDGKVSLDVFAHEWAHAELSARYGFITRNVFMPTWIDEGVAMQVDWREAYAESGLAQLLSEDGLAIPADMQAIKRANNFFRADSRGRLHYALSKCVVHNLLESWTLDDLVARTSSVSGINEANALLIQTARSVCVNEPSGA